jgi:plastocyanin
VLPTITVRVGDTVTWTNRDGVPHTTTSGSNGVFDGVGWNSPFLSFGQTFSHTFAAQGVFPYTCRVHSGMQGTVTA